MIVSTNAPKGVPVGTGPYRFKEHCLSERVVLERFEGYWREAPPLKQIMYLGMPNETKRFNALLAGSIDIMVGRSPAIFERLSRMPDFIVCGEPKNFQAASKRVQGFKCFPDRIIRLQEVRGPDPLRLAFPRIGIRSGGTGVAQDIDVRPTLIDFGRVPFSQPPNFSNPTKSVTVSNSGSCTLTVTEIKLEGVKPNDFILKDLPSFPHTVPPGGSFTFSVTFGPRAAGPHPATLRISSNDPDEATVNVALRGRMANR
jgi:hypothetical protein